MTLTTTKSNWTEDGQPEATFACGDTAFRVRGGAYPMIQAKIAGEWYNVGNAANAATVARCLDWKTESWDVLPATADTRAVSERWDEIVAACDRLAPRQPAEDNSPYYTRM